jgi:hypothetical protein
MERPAAQPLSAGSTTSPKKAYDSPRLTLYGCIRTITRNSTTMTAFSDGPGMFAKTN